MTVHALKESLKRVKVSGRILVRAVICIFQIVPVFIVLCFHFSLLSDNLW